MTSHSCTRRLVLAALLLAPALAPAQVKVPGAAREAAARALRTFVEQAVPAGNPERLGFRSAEEARKATLGEPFPVLVLGLDALRGWKPGVRAAAISKDARAAWFPVLVGGEPRAKLEVAERDGAWIGGEFGRPSSSREVMATTRSLGAARELAGAPSGVPALLRIPALNALLLLVEGERGEALVPVRGEGLPPGTEAGRAYPAEALLKQLAEAARKVEDRIVR